MKKRNILAILTAVCAVSLTAVFAVNGFQIKPIGAAASTKTMVFNGTDNVPTAVDTQYIATTMSVGTSTGVVSILSKDSDIGSSQITLGGSYFAVVAFPTGLSSTALGQHLLLQAEANNITSLSFTIGGTISASASKIRVVAYCGTLANAAINSLNDSYIYPNDLTSGDKTFTFDLSSKGYTVASIQLIINAFAFSANETMRITSASITWSC
jgi:hypothetical protein